MAIKTIYVSAFTSALMHMREMGFCSVNGEKLPCVLFSPFIIIGLFMQIGLIGAILQEYQSKLICFQFA